ncbi:mediator complex subunit MED7 [Saccharomyces paradoxus]|uniref:Mediator of RNA polymerase II transcription subunit 7 n=1 Tax=Saccharomyces paradoxus TaxID=27291 RepID=A0A8B8UZ36_SACPA|nr:Med7 [Saccharomyces paradoxus]QHS75995.1 Med7 [Saccharomyces paradoxus]
MPTVGFMFSFFAPLEETIITIDDLQNGTLNKEPCIFKVHISYPSKIKKFHKPKMSNDPGNEVSSLYPPPPPYVKFFTQSNLEKLPKYKEKKVAGTKQAALNSSDGSDEEEITCALDYLIPPPMPKNQQYRAFGSIWQVKDQLPDLESMGLTQLYKKSTENESTNYQYKIQELRKLLKSLLLNYLELVGVLSINPDVYERKVEDIRTILVNIHHLLNEYRPHQSRESLIMLLEEQLEYKRGEIREIEQVCKQVQDKLTSIQDTLRTGSQSPPSSSR